MEIILGSESPRRKEILSYFSIPFTQAVSSFDEDSISFQGDPIAYTTTLAKEKGNALTLKYKNQPILTADTVVFIEGKIFNKPKNKEEAFSFLQELSNRWHSVFTAIALTYADQQQVKAEETKILFHSLTPDKINAYLDHVNFLDKAGGFAIQQSGGILVKRIDGCYYNVMGLPLTPLNELLHVIGIDLWHHLKIL